MGDVVELKLREFSGREEDWEEWRFHFFSFVVAKGCHAPAVEDKPLVADEQGEALVALRASQARWDLQSTILSGYLGLACAKGEAKGLVRAFVNDTDGRGAWKALEARYELEAIDALVRLEERHAARRLELGENPIVFFGEMQADWGRFQDLSHPVAEERKVSSLLAKLSGEFGTIKAILRQ